MQLRKVLGMAMAIALAVVLSGGAWAGVESQIYLGTTASGTISFGVGGTGTVATADAFGTSGGGTEYGIGTEISQSGTVYFGTDATADGTSGTINFEGGSGTIGSIVAFADGFGTVNVQIGTQAAMRITGSIGTSAGTISTLTIGTGTVNVCGNVYAKTVDISENQKLTVGGTFSATGTTTVGTGATLNFKEMTFGNELVVFGTVAGTTMNVTSAGTISGGTTNASIKVSGTTTISDTLDITMTAGQVTFTNIATGNGTITNSGTANLTITTLNLGNGTTFTVSNASDGTIALGAIVLTDTATGTLDVSKEISLGAVSFGTTVGGTGTFTLTNAGTVNAFEGKTQTLGASQIINIDGATLNNLGSLTLSGTSGAHGSVIGAGTLNNTIGIINLNGGTIGSQLTLGSTGDAGKLNINLSMYTGTGTNDTATGTIVSGTTSIANSGTTVNMIGLSGGKNNEYFLVFGGDGTAAGVGTLSDALTQTNGLWKYAAGTDSSDNIWVLSTVNTSGIIELANASSTANTGIATAISEMLSNGNLPTEVANVLNSLQGAALGNAITQLNGAESATASASMGVSAAQAFNTAISQVFSGVHTASVLANSGALGGMPESASAGGTPVTYGETAAANCYRWNGWLKTYGGFGGVDGNAANVGYSFGGVGLMTGIDYKVAQELTLGALFGYSYNDSTLKQHLGNATDNLLRMGMYGQYNWNNFFFNTAPTFGIHILDTTRHIDVMGVSAKGSRTGFDFNWFNEVGYTLNFKNFLITPNYSLAMTYMRDPSYTETGAGGANLAVKESDQWSLTQNLGLKLGKAINFCNFTILPEIWGGWEHEYLDSNDVSMAFAVNPGNSWNAPIERIKADRAVFGAGITTIFSNRYEVFGRYDQKIWDGGYNTNFTVGLGIKF